MSFELADRIAALRKKGSRFCVVTVVAAEGSTPRKPGASMLVFPDGTSEGTVGGGGIEYQAIEHAKAKLSSGSSGPELREYELTEDGKAGMVCGGKMSLFFEPSSPSERLTIFGGGHVGRALANVATVAGWAVTVVDHRPDVVSTAEYPEDVDVVCSPYETFLEKRSFGENDWLVIVTHGHEFDEAVLRKVVHYPVAYLGMIGSPKKVTTIFQKLKKDGASTELLDRVRAPIGLNIGTEKPGEIAVAIVAEMLAIQNGVPEVKPCCRP